MAGNSARPGVSVTSRVLALLGAFDGEHRSLTLSQLAKRAGQPLPTAHRLVAELVGWGALVRQPSGNYVVGRRLWDLGLLAPVQSGLRELASPFLQDLYGATLATVHLAIRDGDKALYLDRVSGHTSVPVVSQVGARLPLHATGVGKVLLAHAPDEIQARVLANLTRVTPYTITQPERLREQLRVTRRDGFAVTNEEMSLGACSVAVPIRVGDSAGTPGGTGVSGCTGVSGGIEVSGGTGVSGGTVAAALGLVVARLSGDRPSVLPALQVAAQGIGRAISGVTSAQ